MAVIKLKVPKKLQKGQVWKVLKEQTKARKKEQFPTKQDCWTLEAFMKAAEQIHAEFDCLGDHVKTKRQIEEQITMIIWRHFDRARHNFKA